jgi:hypothetical protein
VESSLAKGRDVFPKIRDGSIACSQTAHFFQGCTSTLHTLYFLEEFWTSLVPAQAEGFTKIWYLYVSGICFPPSGIKSVFCFKLSHSALWHYDILTSHFLHIGEQSWVWKWCFHLPSNIDHGITDSDWQSEISNVTSSPLHASSWKFLAWYGV